MKLRFAPSPTGFLHVGNARVALLNWLFARKQGGRFLLRLDDTDTQRSKPEYAEAIQEDLHWLGLDWDESFQQSDRLDRYSLAAERLKQSQRLYPCLETDEELNWKREQRKKAGKAWVYDRAALRMTAEQLEKAEGNGKSPYWRFLLSGTTEHWDDGVLGEQQVKLPSQSDPVLIRSDGSPLYTFTSVVDDLESGVTHVIRGQDHVTNTGVQIDLWGALGGKRGGPAFAHLPLLMDSDGGPLGKRIGSLSLRQLRRDGVEPAVLVGYLAALGSGRDPRAAMPAELMDEFDLSRYAPSTARFDAGQMLALNKRTLHVASFESVRDRLPEGADEAFWHAVRGNLDLLSEAKPWLDVVRGQIAPPILEGEAEFLRTALAALPPEPWDETTWTGFYAAVRDATGRKGKQLFLPLRLALTGEEHGPEMKTLLPLIGRERAALRLKLASP